MRIDVDTLLAPGIPIRTSTRLASSPIGGRWVTPKASLVVFFSSQLLDCRRRLSRRRRRPVVVTAKSVVPLGTKMLVFSMVDGGFRVSMARTKVFPRSLSRLKVVVASRRNKSGRWSPPYVFAPHYVLLLLLWNGVVVVPRNPSRRRRRLRMSFERRRSATTAVTKWTSYHVGTVSPWRRRRRPSVAITVHFVFQTRGFQY